MELKELMTAFAECPWSLTPWTLAAVAAEIIDAFQGQGNVIKKRDDVHKMAQANKAFAHYAWGN